MSTPAELAQRYSNLSPDAREHLQRLLGSWSVLADLSFSDLLLMIPVAPGTRSEETVTYVESNRDHRDHRDHWDRESQLGQRDRGDQGDRESQLGQRDDNDSDAQIDISNNEQTSRVGSIPHDRRDIEDEPELVVLGQIRPNNRPTLIDQDLVGQIVNESQWSLSAAALHSAKTVRGSIFHPGRSEQVPVVNIPVRFGSDVVGVLLRVSLPTPSGPTSLYERTYLDVFERLANMVTKSAFPFPKEDIGTEETPRVGDGIVVVDADGRVEFASPNAINAFHRMGVYAPPEGLRFSDLGVEESAVEKSLASGRPVVEEVERRPDVIVMVHSIPLLDDDEVTGAMILLRDVTDVRRLDRLLLSKDAAIREVHHRVKNNLQTISSLLSLQARRVHVAEGKQALQEAERRVRSIALVHEILARDPSDQVPFDQIIGSLVRMAEDSVVSARPVAITVSGDLGEVGADIATPLAVVLAELLQNAVEHAFDRGVSASAGTSVESSDDTSMGVGSVVVTLANSGSELSVEVCDDGRGLPANFNIEKTESLGLSIVRDLVVSQLGGEITMTAIPRSEGGGTKVVITVPTRIPRS